MKRYKSKFKESLSAKDKKVIDYFYDKKSLQGNILRTDGSTLTKTGMGSQDIAQWKKGKVEIIAVPDVKSTEEILRYIKKTFPKNIIIN